MTQEDTPTPDSETDSNTRVYPSGGGIWGNRRVVMCVKVDEGLKEAFLPHAKAYFGSVCCPVEAFMAGLLGAIDRGVYPSNTVKIDGGFHVHRTGLKERRLLDPKDLTEEKPDVESVEDKHRELEESLRRREDDLVDEVVGALSPWNGRMSDIYDALYSRGVKHGEAYELHKRIFNILQDGLHSE